jgi:hypothetical protein
MDEQQHKLEERESKGRKTERSGRVGGEIGLTRVPRYLPTQAGYSR